MIYLDIALSLFCLALIARGVFTGFIRQAASILAMVLAFVVAGRFYEESSTYLAPFIHNPKIGFLCAYLIIFLVVYFSIIGLGLLLKKVMSIIFLEWFDRLMGGVFGIFKSAFILSLLFLVISGFLPHVSIKLTKSYYYPLLSSSSKIMLAVLRGEKLRSQFIAMEPPISSLLAGSIPLSKPVRPDSDQITDQQHLIN